MAVSKAPAVLTPDPRELHPRLPTRGIDPAAVWIDYDPVADDVVLYFDRPVGSMNVAIDTPERDYVYFLVDFDDDPQEVVGIHVETFKLWATSVHPRWAPLADPEASPDDRCDAVAALIADAAGLFALHGAGAA